MTRTYSGDPSEVFFTGGGLQQFENFEPEENRHVMTVREGFQKSVNLVFVRLMRDIVLHYESERPVPNIQNLADKISSNNSIATINAVRRTALSKFADKEGREFLMRFYKKYKGKTKEESEQMLIDGLHAQPNRLSILFRSLEPEADFKQFSTYMHTQLPNTELDQQALRGLYNKFGVDKVSLTDRGYLVGIHPLELWLVSYLRHTPQATQTQIIEASKDQRQEVYEWLFKTKNKESQDSRIKQMQEFEAFQDIAANWRHLGYPFETLTPSYATALGASGDRPSALAKLMGIIVNNGKLLPTIKLQQLQFAIGTPYETHFIHKPFAGTQVLPEEITAIVRRSLIDVVQGGTGIRLKDGFMQKDNSVIEIGGKTGTGDQRFVTYAPGGKEIQSLAVNRSATFVFFIGDSFFGIVTAYTHKPYAANYEFTSAMTVQLLKSLMPILQPIVTQPRGNSVR